MTSQLSGNITDVFVERLRGEAAGWVASGVVSADQANAIMERYGASYTEKVKAERQGRMVQIITALGAILFGAGVLLWIGSNWDGLSHMVKLLLIGGSIAGSYAAGIFASDKGYGKTGAALLFLGTIFYGAGIALVAQMYHIRSNSGGLFLLWGIGVFATALTLRSQWFAIFSMALFTIWSFVAQWGSDDLFDIFGHSTRQIDPHYWYLLPLALHAGLAFHAKSGKLFAATLLGAIAWFSGTLGVWDTGWFTYFAIYLSLGVLFLFAAETLDLARTAHAHFARVLSGLGALLVLATTYVLSFNDVLNAATREIVSIAPHAPFDPSYFFVVFLVVALGLGAHILTAKTLAPFVRYGTMGLCGVLVAVAITIAFPFDPGTGMGTMWSYQHIVNPYMFLWNFILLAEVVALIVLGYFLNRTAFVNLGLFAFFVFVMTRYIDTFALYFGTYGSFMMGGVVLLGLGFGLERVRRKLTERMKNASVTAPAA
ncbi:MAG TPA: DUF2157 domain-containing protein [Candidatus Paceibacterota bacterium]|nr:DUF2157 domain-containing protein [Candidatus Paceibacterota bacterium]